MNWAPGSGPEGSRETRYKLLLGSSEDHGGLDQGRRGEGVPFWGSLEAGANRTECDCGGTQAFASLCLASALSGCPFLLCPSSGPERSSDSPPRVQRLLAADSTQFSFLLTNIIDPRYYLGIKSTT